ncbi:MAG: Type 1 glutamine amidotransferase-like domain-containing protein [Bifidobacterium sp.]|uniref:Type 1 glutamine amidotransferase-like domain-containing protein n=1 Tax=Bifidobacterium fermentum TaxID=3059035 RepID=A0AB39UHQ9_9BIFI
MHTLFLTSMFAPMAARFHDFARGDCTGKKACLIPTASSRQKVRHYVNADRSALKSLGIRVADLEVSTASPQEIRRCIGQSDYVVITGGNTFYLLQELRRSEADKAIVDHIDAGKTYIGASAGSVILAPDIGYISHMDSTDAAPELAGDYTGLGVLDFYLVPHVGNFPFKAAAKAIQDEYSSSHDLQGISNHEAIEIRDGAERIIGA